MTFNCKSALTVGAASAASHSRQDGKFSDLVFVRVEKQGFGDANFSGGEMILIGQFLLLDHRVES